MNASNDPCQLTILSLLTEGSTGNPQPPYLRDHPWVLGMSPFYLYLHSSSGVKIIFQHPIGKDTINSIASRKAQYLPYPLLPGDLTIFLQYICRDRPPSYR